MFNYADILYSHDDADINAIMQEYEIAPTNDEVSFMKDILNTSDLKPVSNENLIKFMQTYSPITNFFDEHDDWMHTIAQFAYPIQFNSNSNAFKAYIKTNSNKANILKLHKIAQNAYESFSVNKIFDKLYYPSDVPQLTVVDGLDKYAETYNLQAIISSNVYVRTMHSFMTTALVNGYFMRCLLHLAKKNGIDATACKSEPLRPLIGFFSETDLKTMSTIDLDSTIHLLPATLNRIKSVYIAIYYVYKLSTRFCTNSSVSHLYVTFLNLHRILKNSFSVTAIVNMLTLEDKYTFRYVSYEFLQLSSFYCLGMITAVLHDSLWSANCNVDQLTGINTMAVIESSPYTAYYTHFKPIRNFSHYTGDGPFKTFIQNAPHLKTLSKQFDTHYALVLYVITLPSKGPKMLMLNISKVPIPPDATIDHGKLPNSVYMQIVQDKIPANLMIVAASYYNPFVEAVIKTFPMSEHVRAYHSRNVREKYVDIYGQRYYYITPSMFSEYYRLYAVAVLNAKDSNKNEICEL